MDLRFLQFAFGLHFRAPTQATWTVLSAVCKNPLANAIWDTKGNGNKVCINDSCLLILCRTVHMWLMGCPNPYKLRESWECTFLQVFKHTKTK